MDNYKCDWCGATKEGNPKATTEDKQFCSVNHQVAFLNALYSLFTAWFIVRERPLGR